MHDTHLRADRVGTVLDTRADLAGALAHVREHPGPVEVTLGADRPVGLHQGSLVRRQAGVQLRAAGADPLLLRAPVSIDEDMPDEGVIATVDDALSLCRGVGAEALVLALGGVTHRGRQRQRVYSMVAALAEAASAHGVRLLVQNDTAVDEVLMLLVLLDREFDQGSLDVTDPGVTSMAWDISRTRAAGQDDTAAWEFVRRAAQRAPVLVRGLEHGESGRLMAALPGFAHGVDSRRVVPVEHSADSWNSGPSRPFPRSVGSISRFLDGPSPS